MRLNNTVDGKRTSKPAGYDAFNFSKKQTARTAEAVKGKGREGIDLGANQKVSLGELFRQIKEYKENGKELEDVLIIKAENVRSNDELTH